MTSLDKVVSETVPARSAPSGLRRSLLAALAPVVIGLLALDALITLVVEVLYLPIYLGSVAFPIAALAAAVVNVLLVMGVGAVSDRIGFLFIPLAVWVLGFLACATTGPGGDVMLGSNWTTLLLLFAGLGPAMFYIYGRVNARVVNPR